ncbi:hypothetical protein N8I77_005749 [Diaporthe amygdali]|uniref:NACHT domain-containing protein n=1 Tax=Phomopsis amygdali TaxID=1214568 RepID=A0AAD9SFP0_PHOAM|nr:hypothetical protein N8I77_005749 [Diaporthe amygdali]
MDPLSGAGLAGTVVQFVQFAANLFNVAKEIHRSASGISEETQSLDAIYTRLSALSSNLYHHGSTTHSRDGTTPQEAADVTMVILAKECKIDCDRLLSVLRRLKHGHGNFPKWWKSFKSALKELWKGDEIEALEARIAKHQTQLIMHMCMSTRHESIPLAYPATFEWVFDKKSPQNSHLLEWLESGSEIFWISGKPGAGKSTFIKYVADSLETNAALQKWASGSRSLTACHYFWSGGTSIQRSHEGLLRSLLYDIFFEAPELFPEACPRRWQRTLSSRKTKWTAWSTAELRKTLFDVVKKAKVPFSFCFFIDGLDEAYMEDADNELCETIIALSTCPNVKLCVSSRPWNRFTEYFGSRPTLSIHELTRNDIRNFAQHELGRHPRWRSLANEQGMRDNLIVEIVQRAQGVFLWVVLVVRQLREGLTNYDTSKDLWKRLDRIPDGLTKFFRLIIESVEPFYLQKMAETLLIAAVGQGPLHSAIYTFHDRCDANPNYAIEEPLVPWEDEQLASEVRPYSIRLNSRCKGLLEVDAFDRVNFLHRTVRDFLQMEEMREILKRNTCSRFDAGLSIFQAYICWIKHSAFVSMGGIAYHGPSKSLLVGTLETALSYAGKSDSPFLLDLIDDLDWSVYRMFNTGQATFAGTETIQQTQNLFRTCILRTGLDDYSIKKLVREPQYLQGLEVPPLVSVLKLDSQDENDQDMRWSARRVNLLQSLLDHGHDPNEVYVDPETGIETTPWCELARRLMPCPQLEQDQLPTEYPRRPLVEAVSRGVISMLLDGGADPNAIVEGEEDSPEPLAVWVKFFLACFSTPALVWHSEQYLKDLNKLMHKADLYPNTGFVQPLGEWLVREPIAVVCLSLGVPTSLRAAVWNILRCFLRKDPETTSKPRSYRELQFYSKIIQIFLRQDDLSKLPLDDIRAGVEQGMPVSLVSETLERINNFLQSRQETKPPSKRRRPLDGDGDEDMALSPGHKAPRLSFICDFPNGMLERQAGRRQSEMVRV